MSKIYHDFNRKLQKHFNSERLADRLEELIVKNELSAQACQFISNQNMFFISTVDQGGHPTVSYKGGSKGFVKILDNKTIAFPGYDGNGMFLSAGNILSEPKVGLLFIDFEHQKRLRLHGRASIYLEDALLTEYAEAKYIVRIEIENVFDNCPRYIHKMQLVKESKFVPQSGYPSPTPEWKKKEDYKDYLP